MSLSSRSTSSGASSSCFDGVAAGPSGVVYDVGYLGKEGSWNLGNGVTVSTKELADHPLLAKFGN